MMDSCKEIHEIITMDNVKLCSHEAICIKTRDNLILFDSILLD